MSDAVAKVLTGPRLVIRHPDGETIYPLLRPEVVLGRIDSADVVLQHPTVSRVHARVSIRNGIHHVVDLGSRAGTLLNGEPVADGGSPLNNGDEVAVGAVVIVYER